MREPNEKREHILRTAAGIISRKGYHGTGLQEILTACDIAKGSFYHYFPKGKEQLAAELAVFAYERMERGIKNRLFPGKNDAREIFSDMAKYLSRLVLSEDEMMPSLLMTFLGLESVHVGPMLSEACQQVYTRWQQLYEEKLLDCGYGPEMSKQLALACFTLVHGAMISSWVKRDCTDLLMTADLIETLLPAPPV